MTVAFNQLNYIYKKAQLNRQFINRIKMNSDGNLIVMYLYMAFAHLSDWMKQFKKQTKKLIQFLKNVKNCVFFF